MATTTSTYFPFLDEWKEFTDKHIILEVLDNVLLSFAQIALNENSFSGILLIFATYMGSPVQALSGVWAAVVGTLTAYLFGIPRPLIRTGMYGFNPTLCGLAIPVLVFPGQALNNQILLYSALASIFSVTITVGLAPFFSTLDLPFLAIPYCVTLLLFVPAALALGNIEITRTAPELAAVFNASSQAGWTRWEFLTASLNGIAQILWIDNPITGAFYLIAVLMVSRIDVMSSILAAGLSVAVSIALGLPKEVVMTGVYGFNAVLLVKAMTRGFFLDMRSYGVALLMSVLTVIVAAGLRVIFAPIGAVTSFAFPFALLAHSAFMGRDLLTGMTYIPAEEWGMPETSNRLHREEI